jgi:hypothetical protein
VSLTCEVQVNNDRLWWLTRESGRAAHCWWQPSDGARSSCGDDCGSLTAKAYIVIKVALNAIDAIVARRWKVVAICALEPGSARAIERHILPWLRKLPPSQHSRFTRGSSVREFFSLLDEGMFSADDDCMCRGIAVCRACRRIDVKSRRIMTQHHYQGSRPRGKGHWFEGRTDAVGDIAHGQMMWLSCHCGPQVQECIVV